MSFVFRYVRLSNDTTMPVILELLRTHWHLLDTKMRPCHLVLSLAQESGEFKLEGSRKAAFMSGICGTVKAANALVITRGMDVGEAEAIGEAVRGAQYVIQARPRVK
jgi:hypothetical protein